MNHMKILLTQPRLPTLYQKPKEPPLNLALLVSVVERQGFTVKCIDMEARPEGEYRQPHVVHGARGGGEVIDPVELPLKLEGLGYVRLYETESVIAFETREVLPPACDEAVQAHHLAAACQDAPAYLKALKEFFEELPG